MHLAPGELTGRPLKTRRTQWKRHRKLKVVEITRCLCAGHYRTWSKEIAHLGSQNEFHKAQTRAMESSRTHSFISGIGGRRRLLGLMNYTGLLLCSFWFLVNRKLWDGNMNYRKKGSWAIEWTELGYKINNSNNNNYINLQNSLFPVT